MCRFSVFAVVVVMIDIPCGTIVVTRRQVSAFTCVSIFRILLGLNVICLLCLADSSGLVMCTTLLYFVRLLVHIVCNCCYDYRFSRAHCR